MISLSMIDQGTVVGVSTTVQSVVPFTVEFLERLIKREAS